MNMRAGASRLISGADLLLITLLLVVLTAILMLPSNPLDSLPGRDNGVFLYGGQQILLGQTPYLDFWDHKGPLIHYLNAVGLWIAGGSRWGVWGLEFVFLVLTGLGIYQAAKVQWGIVPALVSLAGWTYGIVTAGSYFHFRDSNYTETYSLLFNVTSVYFWIHARNSTHRDLDYALIGAMAGCTFLLRPNNSGAQTAIALIEIFRMIRSRAFAEGLKRIGYLALGGLAVLAAVFLYFAARGAVPELVDAVFAYNLIYRHSGISSLPQIVVAGLALFQWVLPLLYVVILVRFCLGFSKEANGRVSGAFTWFLLIGWPIEALLTALSSRILLHYYITWIPYLSWLAGGAAAALFAPAVRKLERVPAVWWISTLLVLVVAGNLPAVVRSAEIANRLVFHPERGVEKGIAVVDHVVEGTRAGDRVLVWGNEVWINFFSRRTAPTKYAYQYPLFMPGYTDGEKVRAFLRELETRPPALIVEPTVDTDEILPLSSDRRDQMIAIHGIPDGMEAVFQFVDSRYCVEARLRDIIVYQLKINPNTPCE